ncbi:serine racemase VanT catalytic subunit [Bacillus sp. AFS041924]|uniref:serine racemase VanT catalytic subunit n=1 Tax=Bacillus sp. AFS041924 TaxID=2033503 RepID=UPI000BFE311E|nr:serine racemase VanT catalytic subunit [Bacillus sp. AFS041924]PGS46074.1 alanine racemase [Bacillus sp. AFS041924]
MTCEDYRAWVEVDLTRLDHNVMALMDLLPPETEFMAVIKANAYGHGSVEVAKRLVQSGVHQFAVAEIDEAIKLRRNGIEGEILILGYTPTHRLDDLLVNDLTQTVVNAEDGERLGKFGKNLKVHVKIDTGLNRLGEHYENTDKILSMYRHKNLQIEGTFSHLAAADSLQDRDDSFTRAQYNRLQKIAEFVLENGYKPGKFHILNSYGILNYPDMHLEMVRSGIALYGVLSSTNTSVRSKIILLPVLSLKARVSRVNRVKAGNSVGYGLSFTATRDSVVATVTIGYADGIPRQLSELGGEVLICGQRAPIIGNISMDQLSVDVTEINNIRQGDIVTLIGQDGSETINSEDIATLTGTITNELLSTIGDRVKRKIIK